MQYSIGRNVRRIAAAGTFVALAAAAQPAFASTAPGTLSVTATVADSCSVTTSAVAFGTVTVAGNTDNSGSISVTCTNGTAFTAAADGGANGTVDARKMAVGGHTLDYALYTDSARTLPWGDGTAGTSAIAGTGDGTTQVSTIYGRVPSGQNPFVGSYTDTVNVTVTY